MKTKRSRRFQFLLGALLIMALALPMFPAEVASAQGPSLVSGSIPSASVANKEGVRFRNFSPSTIAAEYEIGVGVLGTANLSTGNLNWNDYALDKPHHIKFTYNPSIGQLEGAVVTNAGAKSAPDPVVRSYAPALPPNYMEIVLKTDGRGVLNPRVEMRNITLNGSPLGNLSAESVAGSAGFNSWMLQGFSPAAGFVLEADIAMDGQASGREAIAFDVVIGYVAPPPTSAGISVDDTTICVGDPATINVNFASVTDLYGYEFKVNYPVAGFTATGAFVNDWFDTTGAFIPWDGTPDGGVVKFAASKQAPAMPVSGSGTVAQVELTATEAGVYDITLDGVLLGDRDGNQIAADVSPNKVTVEVCGFAKVSGKVTLQGRSAPPTGTDPATSGTVTLADAGFGAFSATFDATGAFTIDDVKVAPGGTDYTITAAHGLYLSNQLVQNLTPGATVTLPDTRLKGGDADNSGLIDVYDLACIGGAFGAAPAICGATGSSDINADGLVNILDLVLPGGNYLLGSPQAW